jgi:polyhydroxybutyrate depolymerase
VLRKPGAAAPWTVSALRLQKESGPRPIVGVGHEITAFLATALLPILAIACASSDIDLGQRGAITGAPGSGLSPANNDPGDMVVVAGAGGHVNVAGQGEATAGASGQAAGSAGVSAMTGSGGAAAMTGASGSGSALQMSSGCGMDPRSSDTSLQVNGMTGSYILDLPTGYDKNRPYPLVMSFRGAGVTADAFRGYLTLPLAVGADAIVVNANCLGDAAAWDVNRDVPFFDALLTQIESGYCVDEHRIFAAGHSAGGFFTNALGCIRGNKLRGIAPLSAGPPPGACLNELAVWMSQGNIDMGIAAGMADRDFWAQRNNCDATMSTPVDPSPCVEYAGCDPGFAVRYCEYDGDLGLPSFAATGIWEFFKGL